MKVGSKRRDGWVRKVLKMPRCQEKKTALIIPGAVEARKATVGIMTKLLPVPFPSAIAQWKIITKKMAFPTSVKKQAKKSRRNRLDRYPLRRPPTPRTLQGPTFRALAIPRLAVIIEVPYVARKKCISLGGVHVVVVVAVGDPSPSGPKIALTALPAFSQSCPSDPATAKIVVVIS